MQFATEQEAFWTGEFGDAYTERNVGATWIASNTALFAEILRSTESVGSVLEFGANVGLNLHAIRNLLPRVDLAGVEINAAAAKKLRSLDGVEVYEASMLDFDVPRCYDLVLVKGVLIHINPDYLSAAYDRIYRAARRYICLAEYYSPSPVSVPYRGHSERLFKRDFAGDLMKRFPSLRLVNYGFKYRNDPNFPQDDITWFVLEKTGDPSEADSATC